MEITLHDTQGQLFDKERKENLAVILSQTSEDWKEFISQYEGELQAKITYLSFEEIPQNIEETKWQYTVKCLLTYQDGEQEEIHVRHNEKTSESVIYTVSQTEKIRNPIIDDVDTDWAKNLCEALHH